MQTPIDRVRAWLQTYPGQDLLSRFQVDWTDEIPNTGGLFPSGMVEVSRRSTITGRVTVKNQYHFGLYYTFLKSPGDPLGAEENQEWISDFQGWVQDQSCRRLAPAFGDVPGEEKIQAQNGTLYTADGDGTALYMVQLSVQFVKIYEK